MKGFSYCLPLELDLVKHSIYHIFLLNHVPCYCILENSNTLSVLETQLLKCWVLLRIVSEIEALDRVNVSSNPSTEVLVVESPLIA